MVSIKSFLINNDTTLELCLTFARIMSKTTFFFLKQITCYCFQNYFTKEVQTSAKGAIGAQKLSQPEIGD